jgi:hypothetical protein
MKTVLLMVKRGRIYDYAGAGQYRPKRGRFAGPVQQGLRYAGYGQLAAAVPVAGAAWQLATGIRDTAVAYNRRNHPDRAVLADALFGGDKKTIAALTAYHKKHGTIKGFSKARRGAASKHHNVNSAAVPTGRPAHRVKRRKRRRRKKEPLSRRVGRLEKAQAHETSRISRVAIANFTPDAVTAGQTQSPNTVQFVIHDRTGIEGLFTSGRAVTTYGITTNTAWTGSGTEFPKLAFVEPDRTDTSNLANYAAAVTANKNMVQRNPFLYDGGTDFPFSANLWKKYTTYMEITMYNGHTYPVFVQFNELSPKEALCEEHPFTQALEHFQDSALNSGLAYANSKYILPENNIFKVRDCQKYWHVKTRTVEIPAGGNYTYKIRATCSNFNQKKHDDVLDQYGVTGATNAYCKHLGSRLLFMRTWGALGHRGSEVSDEGAITMPVNELHGKIKVFESITYDAGGGPRIVDTSTFNDYRDTSGTAKVIAADHGEKTA